MFTNTNYMVGLFCGVDDSLIQGILEEIQKLGVNVLEAGI
jgi:hypothetical protein